MVSLSVRGCQTILPTGMASSLVGRRAVRSANMPSRVGPLTALLARRISRSTSKLLTDHLPRVYFSSLQAGGQARCRCEVSPSSSGAGPSECFRYGNPGTNGPQAVF